MFLQACKIMRTSVSSEVLTEILTIMVNRTATATTAVGAKVVDKNSAVTLKETTIAIALHER